MMSYECGGIMHNRMQARNERSLRQMASHQQSAAGAVLLMVLNNAAPAALCIVCDA